MPSRVWTHQITTYPNRRNAPRFDEWRAEIIEVYGTFKEAQEAKDCVTLRTHKLRCELRKLDSLWQVLMSRRNADGFNFDNAHALQKIINSRDDKWTVRAVENGLTKLAHIGLVELMPMKMMTISLGSHSATRYIRRVYGDYADRFAQNMIVPRATYLWMISKARWGGARKGAGRPKAQPPILNTHAGHDALTPRNVVAERIQDGGIEARKLNPISLSVRLASQAALRARDRFVEEEYAAGSASTPEVALDRDPNAVGPANRIDREAAGARLRRWAAEVEARSATGTDRIEIEAPATGAPCR